MGETDGVVRVEESSDARAERHHVTCEVADSEAGTDHLGPVPRHWLLHASAPRLVLKAFGVDIKPGGRGKRASEMRYLRNANLGLQTYSTEPTI